VGGGQPGADAERVVTVTPPPAAEADGPTVDPRLLVYLVVGFGALVASVVVGRYELVATAVPFMGLAAVGLSGRRPPQVEAEVRLVSERVLEGDDVEGEVVVSWDGEAELDLVLVSMRGVVPLDPMPAPGWSLPAGEGPAVLPFRVRARVWGRHDLGQLWLRSRRPGGMFTWERQVATGPDLRVLPAPLRLNRLLHPAEPRTVAGAHLSRLRGSGTDFADLRPYQPGDRLRDLSWATSARTGEPWVTVHHPERTGTVLLLLDAFFAKDEASTEGLARAARAAWAVASAHLRVQDQVGLLAVGRTAAWLPPRGGRRARWMLLDELLAVGAAAEDWRRRRWRTRSVVPADALVVGITSLRSPGFPQDLLHHRRSGRTTVALVIDNGDLLPTPRDAADAAAQRIWQLDLQMRRYDLERSGIPTAVVRGEGGVGAAVSLVRKATARRAATGGGTRQVTGTATRNQARVS
jgi:uncharacterized protein (DUF58 family)